MLTEQLTIRPVETSDIDAAVALMNRCSQVSTGCDGFTPEQIRSVLTTPGFDLARDTRVAVDADGTLLGYMEIWALGKPPVRIHSWMCVDPGARDSDIAARLLAWGEERAREAIPLTPEGSQVSLGCSFNQVDTYGGEALTTAGFSYTRNFYRMEIALDQPIPAPQWPAGITVRTVNPDSELAAIVQAHRDAFKDHWGYVPQTLEHDMEQWAHWPTDPDYDPAQWWIALDGDEIAGYSICNAASEDDPEMGWVGVLGVRRAWRRKGLALALLHHSFGEFKQRGKLRAGLGVDASSLTNAVALYERAGMRSTRIFKNFEKILRDGVDLSTQSAAQAAAS